MFSDCGRTQVTATAQRETAYKREVVYIQLTFEQTLRLGVPTTSLLNIHVQLLTPPELNYPRSGSAGDWFQDHLSHTKVHACSSPYTKGTDQCMQLAFHMCTSQPRSKNSTVFTDDKIHKSADSGGSNPCCSWVHWTRYL